MALLRIGGNGGGVCSGKGGAGNLSEKCSVPADSARSLPLLLDGRIRLFMNDDFGFLGSSLLADVGGEEDCVCEVGKRYRREDDSDEPPSAEVRLPSPVMLRVL